jgi:hypothetical protein
MFTIKAYYPFLQKNTRLNGLSSFFFLMLHLFVERLGSHELLRSCFLEPLDQAPAFFEASFQVLTRLVSATEAASDVNAVSPAI